MRRILIIYTMFLIVLFLNACLTKGGIPKHPCQGNEFLKDIAHYSKPELTKLARVLESSTYAGASNNGCRAALLGQVYLALEKMSKASDYFSIAARKLPELSEYFLLAKARAELKKQNFDQAHKIASSLLDSKTALLSSQFSLRVRKVLADIATEKKDDHQIIETHRALLAKGFPENEVLLFNLATALINIKEHQKANEIFKKLLINFPASQGAKRAEQLQTLAQYNLDLKETEKRFDKLIEKLAFDRVVKDSDLLLKSASHNEEAKSHLRGMAVKSLILNNQFNEGLKRAERHRRTSHTKDLETYAWGLAKVDRFLDAADYYAKFMTASKNAEDKAKGCFFRGFSLYESSLYSMALFAWQSCHSVIKDSSYYENYLWYQALVSMLNHDYIKSSSLLTDLKTVFKKSAEAEKYQYFLGYSLSKLNKQDEALVHYRELSKKKEPSYYVLLAKKSLGLHEQTGKDIPADGLSRLARNIKNTDCKNALVLFHLGFKDEARDLILRSKTNEVDKQAMLQHIGFYHDAWQRSHLLGAGANPALKGNEVIASRNIRASYPLPHRSIMNEFSEKYGVSSSLLYAIMRVESGFSEQALSPRGARGLMQMMPFVAEELASHLSINTFNSEDLQNPKVAIELGAMFVALLQKQFSRQHLVVAAYNAGPHQVQKWLDRFGHLPTELFVERIPFSQTRNYIKRVLPSESLYQAMNGKKLRLAL